MSSTRVTVVTPSGRVTTSFSTPFWDRLPPWAAAHSEEKTTFS